MKASLNQLHHQTNDWTRELEFYREELSILTKRLEEVTSHNNAKEVMEQVEHFQNRFIVLREQLDILMHDVHQRNHQITEISKTKPDHTNEKFSDMNAELQERMKSFSHQTADTRFEFNTFLSKVF